MKILKMIGIGLLAIIGLLLIISFFLPSDMHVERSMVINASAEAAFTQINTPKNWEKWSPWYKMEPTAQMTYFGPEAGTGAGYTWKGAKTGEGKMTITDSKSNELIVTELDFGKMGKAGAGYRFEPADNGVKVSWYFDSEKSSNPLVKYMNVMMKGMLEKQFDEGLAGIKTLAESMPPPVKKNPITVEATTVAAQAYLAVRDTASIATISQKLGTYYGMIGETIGKQGLKMAGAPFAIYYTDSQTNWDMEAALPVDKTDKADGKVKPGELKAGNAVVAHFFGSYELTGDAHTAAHEFIKANNKKIIGAPWEVYITDPMTEKDTAKWQTDVYYPVE